MDLSTVTPLVAGIPHTTAKKGAVLYGTVLQNKFTQCLELGFACGVGSSYIAAALDEQGAGSLVSVDLPAARKREPTGPDLLKRIGLSERVEFIFDDLGYNWYLMEALEKGRQFDFCFLDGAHTWEIDALAFTVVDLMLKPGGIIIFDDLDWTYATSPTMKDKPAPEKMRHVPGVRKVIDLMVKPNERYEWMGETEGMGIARRVQ